MGDSMNPGATKPKPDSPPIERLRIRPAGPPDVPAIVAVLTEAAEYQRSFKGGGAWPVPFPPEPVEVGVSRGEFHVAERSGSVIGTFSLSWEDPQFWGPRPPDSGYLHKLAVRRSESHRGVGRELIEWAARGVRQRGRSRLRLDCLQGDARLVAYYERAGFRKVRVIRLEFGGKELDFQLMERALD